MSAFSFVFRALLVATALSASPVWAQVTAYVRDESQPFAEVPARTTPFEVEQPYGPEADCGEVIRSIRVLNPKLMVGEPLLLELRLEGAPGPNVSEAEFAQPLQFGRDIHIYVDGPRGRPFEYVPSQAINQFAPNVGTRLIKDQVHSILLTLAYDRDSPTGGFMDWAGDYRIRVVLDCIAPGVPPGTQSFLGDFSVSVYMPQRGTDNFLSQQILWNAKDPELFAAMHNLAMNDPANQRGHFQAIVNQADDSLLRPYALMILAQEPFATYLSTGKMPEEDAQGAEKLYTQFLDEYPDHPLRSTAIQRLLILYDLGGQEDKAREMALLLWRDPYLTRLVYPETPTYELLGAQPDPLVADAHWPLFENPADSEETAVVEMTAEEREQQQMMNMLGELLSGAN